MAAAAFRLPQFIVVKPYKQVEEGYNGYYKKNNDGSEGGSLGLGSEKDFSIFSPLVKIEAERATSNDNYVNLRFCNSNRYWQKATGDDASIAALSKKPIEDTSDESCTLFEPFPMGDDPNSRVFYLKHVSSGKTVAIDEYAFHLIDLDTPNEAAYLTYLDWETLVKLPDHVALKGDNGMYIQPYTDLSTGIVNMLFYGAEASDYWSVYKVVQTPDGHVQLISETIWRNWKSVDDLILLEPCPVDLDDDVLFWPVKIDGDTIVLQNKNTGKFCIRSTVGEREDCVASTGSTIIAATKLQVEEPVLDRKIYYVNYMMEDARIFDEQPYLAGSSVLINATDFPTSQSVTITYQDEKSYTFSRGVSVTAGVKTEIKAGIPFIAEEKIEVSFEVTGNFQWDTTTTTTTSIAATGTVEVPARSSVVVEYVGTKGSCNIPYAYTQLDKSATDGKIKRTEHIDGTYTGVSCYNFNFKMRAPTTII